MKSTYSYWMLFALLMLVTGFAHAEGGCPPGFQPTGAAPTPQDPVACRPMPENNQRQMPPPRWEDRWGAIATDGLGGSFGASSEMPTQQSAHGTALAICRSKKGSNTCQVEIDYINQCAAMTVGDVQHNTAAGLTGDLAVQAAMNACNADDDHCFVYYVGCSLPQRVQ